MVAARQTELHQSKAIEGSQAKVLTGEPLHLNPELVNGNDCCDIIENIDNRKYVRRPQRRAATSTHTHIGVFSSCHVTDDF